MDENTIFDKVHDIDLKKTMENSYIDYAMSVIASRALPDVRDGLKPVQRRILYAMIELNNGPDKPHRKCARIVGDTMGKYHPHGDSSIYGALVNMAQEWSTRYPLVDGHGNFGSVDGDGAAAMRYTEARLSKISMELLADINKNTVDFRPNFDETEKEPAVLPSRFPNLLVNGTQGIAVGMATNIPPHNLREVINAVIKIIDNQVEEDRETTIEELLEIIKGPDFPTGATILGRSGIDQAYRTGRGKIKVRAVTDIEAMANGKQRIIVTELPYMVNKARLIEKIATLVREKKVEGITELRDESDRSGMRICIELRRDANANVILNQLYKHTQLQDTFGVIMLALVDGQPKTMNLHEMLDYYLTHQKDVVTRRTRYELNKAEERAHILEGLLIAQDNIDEVIKIILEPNEPGKGYEFINAVTGGAIPKEFIEPVNQGIQSAMQNGVLAGYNVVDVKVTLYDGSYHEVDSSEMAFHIAGSMAFKEAMAKASPVLLEPIMKVEVTMPEEYMGDVIGDINSRRGRIEGMDDIGGGKMVKAYVPLAEMFGYSTDLRSKTQGRGNYSMFFEKYEPVPKSVQEKVLADKSK